MRNPVMRKERQGDRKKGQKGEEEGEGEGENGEKRRGINKAILFLE